MTQPLHDKIIHKEVVIVIRALRPVACILSIGLTVASFHLAQVRLHWPTLIAVFLATATTMLQNDWRDRKHDAERKGKRYAYDREASFCATIILFWACTSYTIYRISHECLTLGATLGLMALAGAVYSETRLIPMVPITIVALTSASPALLPVALGGKFANVSPLFVATAFAMFGNEIVKDIDDEPADRGYKWTLPIAIGQDLASRLSIAAVGIALAIALCVTPYAILGALPIIRGWKILLQSGDLKRVENHLDLGMVVALIMLTLFGM